MPYVDQKNASNLVSLVETESISEINVLYFQSVMHFSGPITYMKNIQIIRYIFNFLPLLLCIWIPLSYCHTDTPPEAPVSSLHRHVIVNKTDGWKEIDLVYEKTFSHNLSNDNKTIAGCVKAYNTAGKTLFRCKEHIILLRQGKVIKHWLEEQQQAGYINLTIKEFGLINTRAYISAVKPAFIS